MSAQAQSHNEARLHVMFPTAAMRVPYTASDWTKHESFVVMQADWIRLHAKVQINDRL